MQQPAEYATPATQLPPLHHNNGDEQDKNGKRQERYSRDDDMTEESAPTRARPTNRGIVQVQPLRRDEMQPSYAQTLPVGEIEHGCYGSMINCLGAFAGGLGSIPCCFCCPNPFKTVKQGSVGLVTRFGQFYKAVDPGLTKVNPFSEHLAQIDVKIQVVELPLQSILTKDNLQAQIESVIVWQVTNPYRAAFGVSDVRRALIERAQTTLRDVVGGRNLQSVLTEREAVAAEIEEIVEHVSEKWGVRVESILIKDIVIPPDLQSSLSAAAQQRRLGEAKVLAASAEVDAARLMREAADILSSPAALQIRQLEALQAMSKGAGTKVLFVPMNLFGGGGSGSADNGIINNVGMQQALANIRANSHLPHSTRYSIMSKRPQSESTALLKRQRTEDQDPSLQELIVAAPDATSTKGALIQTVKRTSGLTAPIMCLRGHQAEVLDVQFSPDGDSLATASADKTILLWRVYGDCQNYGALRLGKGTPTSIAYTSPTTLVAGSSDHTLFLFDLKTGEVLRRFRGHKGVVNSVDVQAGRGLIASASDDGTVRVWSEDAKEELEVVELGYPITAVKWSEDGQSLFIAGLDNDVHVFSLTTHAISYTLRSHSDTVTSLALSPANSQLLSCGMDSTLHLWSVQPFAPTINTANPALHPRLVRSFYGAPAGFEQLLRRASFSRHTSPEGQKGTMVAAGGADRAVTVWDTTTGEIRYKLPGHTGTVISTAWSPKEPILASGGVEGVVYLGEVDAV